MCRIQLNRNERLKAGLASVLSLLEGDNVCVASWNPLDSPWRTWPAPAETPAESSACPSRLQMANSIQEYPQAGPISGFTVQRTH
ncbi:g5966 [Coccomyxa viridis]|uniref:G5966 protein n=1 Tax=Coccomyxa viridis TaxID=1274662 RepID=A0ABP1FZB5_9CHLO